MPHRTLIDRTIVWPLLVLFALLGSFPFLWAFLTSIKIPADAFSLPPTLWFKPTWSAYLQVLDDDRFLDYFFNSLVVSVTVVIISTVLGCLAGYALARYSGISSGLLLALALVLYATPRTAILLPYYRVGQALGLYDTRTLLILAMVAVNQPLTIWIFESFFRDIPVQLEQAAMVDGCSRMEAFWRVIVPLMGPGIATTAIFSLLFSYNEFLLPIILSGPDAATMPVLIASEASASDVGRWPQFAATAVIVALPLVGIIMFAQKLIMRGLIAGAVKG